jgi:hypothetical protein
LRGGLTRIFCQPTYRSEWRLSMNIFIAQLAALFIGLELGGAIAWSWV